MSLYCLSGITKIFGEKVALNISNLILEEGCIYALLGANGAGKTTLLNILSFLEKPSTGTLVFRSEKVEFLRNELKNLRRQVALVDQRPLLFSTTVYKNLEFGLKIRKIPKEIRAALISDALELVGMLKFQHKSAVTLSGGEIQRVALARAFVLEPRVLLCDEPTANVDSANQLVIVDLLKQINAAKKMSIVFTTHDSGLAANLAKKTLYLDKGHIIDGRRLDNNFTVRLSKNEDGTFSYFLPKGTELHNVGSPPSTLTKMTSSISIDPWKIRAIREGDALPESNIFKGKIRKIEMEEKGVRLILEAGESFAVMITEKNYLEMKMLVGEKVFLSIPGDAIQVLS